MKKIYSLIMALMAFVITLKAQNVQYLPLYTDQNFSKTINTYLPVGKTEGSLNVTPNGTATYSIPLTLPPSTKNIMPSMSIEYSSQGGNGNMGIGWNLSSGISVISRTGKNLHLDNEVSPIRIDYTDLYTLDGNRLVPNPDGSFGTKQETFSKITRFGSNSGSPDWFKVETKNGMTYEYGNTIDSKVSSVQFTTLFWYLNKAYDQYGNYMEYVYESNGDEKRIKEIKYTGNANIGLAPYNKVIFNYQNKTDKLTQYIGGQPIDANSLLTEIIVTTEGGAQVRKYMLNYGIDDVHSFLREVIEFGSDNYSQLNSTIFKYGVPTIGMQSVDSQNFVGKIIGTGDFNGDGLKDILTGEYSMISGIESLSKFYVYRKNSDNGQFTLTYSTLVTNVLNPYLYKGHFATIGDADGDGRDDVFIFAKQEYYSTNIVCRFSVYVPNSDATSFNYATSLSPTGIADVGTQNQSSNICSSTIPSNSGTNFLNLGDFNGDGRIDFIALLGPCATSSDPLRAILFTPAKPNQDATNSPKFSIINIPYSGGAMDWVNASRLQVLDFNGDGKTDLMVTKIIGSSTSRKIYSFRSYSISTSPYIETLAEEIYTNTTYFDAVTNFKLGDFNGDGKTDLLGTDNSNSNIFILTSTGKSFIKKNNAIPYSVNPDIGDFNGDGLSDIYASDYKRVYNPNTSKWEYSISQKLYFSNGNELVYKEFTSPYSTIPTTTLADFNGDGKTDIYAAVNSNGYTNYIHSFNPLTKNNALEKVTDGFNNTSSISYKYLTEGSSIYTKNMTSSYPVNVVQAPIMVVSSVTTPDGIGGVSTAMYKYENAKLHRAGVGFLGFTTFQQDNAIQDGRSITEFEVLTPQYLTAVKKQTTKQISNNTILSELINTNNVTVNGTRYWQKTQSYEDKNLLTGATKGVSRVFDALGNVTAESFDIVGVEVGTTSMGNFNAFGQPGYVYSYKKRFETPNWDYTWSSKSYDAKGALNWETFDQYDYSTGWQNTSTTNYDYYQTVGLPKSTTVTSSGLLTKTTTINSYDPKWRFATKMTNPLGQSSEKTYDPRWGAVLTEKDITGLITTNYYDAFGKIYQTTTPQGISITKQYIWNPYLYLPRRFDIITTTPGRPTTWDTYDIFGRKIVASTQNYGSPTTRWVDTYQLTEYDNRGNVSKQSTPVNGDEFANEAEFTTFQYDALNRSTSSSNAIGTSSYTYAYSAGKTTVTMTNPAGQVSSKTTDASGKVVSTTDYGGTLNFEYDNKGNQTAVKLGSIVLTSMTYDYRGNQTALTDKNAGTTQYRYNAYGELVWQKDAMNTEYSMTYDIMGRLLTRYSLIEGMTSNEYVTTGNGLNQIKKVTGINGINQEYIYDIWHRVSQAKETIDGTVYTKSFTYNIYNDIETTTYPSGLVIKNRYSDDGFLFKVEQNNGQILFDGTDGTMNGYGKWKNYKLGNIATDIVYNHWAMPQNIKGGGGSIQNLLLDWNLQTGNLNYRYDVRKYKYESFTYDNQNRLRTAQVGGLPEQSYVIDDIGNIKSKTDVGTYFYHPNKIHAVEDIKNPQGVVSIVPSMQQDIIYTKYHRVEKITEPASQSGTGVNELSFVYASDYERRKTVLKQNNVVVNTRYFMGDYEIDNKNGITRHIHYIGGGDGLCAIVVKEGFADFNFFFTYKDHLGSILTVTDKFGGIVAEQNFDAWGRKRNFATWDYAGVQSVPDWLYRGFTGHEHLAEFGLINMNARLYDPILGRMLSPDNLVGAAVKGLTVILMRIIIR